MSIEVVTFRGFKFHPLFPFKEVVSNKSAICGEASSIPLIMVINTGFILANNFYYFTWVYGVLWRWNMKYRKTSWEISLLLCIVVIYRGRLFMEMVGIRGFNFNWSFPLIVALRDFTFHLLWPFYKVVSIEVSFTEKPLLFPR